MAHHKELIDITRDITSSFNSRNNDFQGYWALGVLYQFASMHNINSFEFELLSRVIQPDAKHFYQIVSKYNANLQRLLNSKNMDVSWLKKATIIIYFNHHSEQHNDHTIYSIGDPYIIIGKLVDDTGKIFESKIYGKCRHHNPNKEHQSTRINKNTMSDII